jgi:hypothetical protein
MSYISQALSTFGGPSADLANVFYAFGIPVQTSRGTRSIYEDTFMRNLRAGRNPLTGLPGGGSGGGSGGGGSGTPNFGNLPAWWVDWYNAQGKHGGVPPVQGLL